MKHLIRILAAFVLLTTACFAQLGVAIRQDLADDPADGPRNSEAGAYWGTPARQDRLNVEGAALVARLNPSYEVSSEENKLLDRWFRFGAGNRTITDAQHLLLVNRMWASSSIDVRSGAVVRATRFINSPAAYANWKTSNWTIGDVQFDTEHPEHGDLMLRVIASRAARFGDWVTFTSLDRSRMMEWPVTEGDYRKWLQHVGQTVTTDQARYDLIQQEIAMVLTAPGNVTRAAVLDLLQTTSDVYFTRLRRAKLLNQ